VLAAESNQSKTLKPLLEIGDYVPNFQLPATTGKAVSAADFAGKSTIVFFYLKDGGTSCTTEARGFRDLYPEFQKIGFGVIGIGIDSEASHKDFAMANNLLFPLLSDASAEVCARFGALRPEIVNEQSAIALSRTTYLVGADSRISKVYSDVQSPNHPAEVLEDARQLVLREEPPQRMIRHAPVLLVPNALPLDLCKTLIEVWEADNGDSGFMKQVDGKTVGMYDYSHKIRRDHFLKPGAVQNRVQSYIANRVVPEILRTFNYAVTRREDFRIGCYDASRGGYFRPHRDNTTEGTAHRRFAMSLLLNDDYEGGDLRFPEFGKHTYRPAAGGAVIFSCSLLHEATDVTAGRRFVLLSFMYGEAEAKAREEYNRRMGGSYRK
jgi:peroxiredoxin/predicted 2-oxoglutarate/Fe(II)-dependent dioxygenase YbiX